MKKSVWAIDVAYTQIEGDRHFITHLLFEADDKTEAQNEYEQFQIKERKRGWEITPCSGKWNMMGAV